MDYVVVGKVTLEKSIRLHLMSSTPTLNDGQGYEVVSTFVAKTPQFESLSLHDEVKVETRKSGGSYFNFVFMKGGV